MRGHETACGFRDPEGREIQSILPVVEEAENSNPAQLAGDSVGGGGQLQADPARLQVTLDMQ